MSVNRLQGFLAGELPFAALVAQLPVAVAGQAGITIPVLYTTLLADPGADTPFTVAEDAFFIRALGGAAIPAAIGPAPNAPIHAACFNRGSGPVVVAIACRDPLMGMLVGTGKALPGNAAGQLGIASTVGAATAHALIQGCFARLTGFVQTVAATYAGRDLVLTGHGTGGYFAMALRCLLPGQVTRSYAFDAPAHGLRAAFPPSGGDVDDRVLEVRCISADSVHQMDPALGRRLLLDAATFGYQVPGPLKDGPGRGTLLDRNLRRLAADPRPEPLLGPILSISGDMPGQLPAAAGHPGRDLLRLLGGHLAQVGQAGTVLRLAMHHDGSVRVDIPGGVAGQSASPARGLRFGSDGTMAIGGVPGGTLHVSSGLTWGDGVGTALTILPWDGGNYASDVPIDPATGLIVGEAEAVSIATLLDSIFGSGAQVALPPIPDVETQITESWRQLGAWIDPALSIDQTPDLLPLLASGLPSAASMLMGMVPMGPARPDAVEAVEAVHGVIRGVVHHVGGYLDALFGTVSGPYQHSRLLWSAELPSLTIAQRDRRPGHVAGYVAVHTVMFLLRGLTTPGAAILSSTGLGDLVAGAAGRFLAGRLGVGPVVSDVAAWQQALAQTKATGADVTLSEIWRLPDPINFRPDTLPTLLAGTELTARPTVSLLLQAALAEAAGLSVPPNAAEAAVARTPSGQKQSLKVTASRGGYNGPLEVLTIRASAVADVPHALVNTILGGLGIPQDKMPSVTLSHRPATNLFDWMGTPPGQAGLAPGTAMTRQLSFLLAAVPAVPDPVIAALLQRGWVDWLLLAQDGVFRQSMPRQPELYNWFDILVATQSSLGLTPASRPARGTDAFIMVGLLAELNRVAAALVASSGNPAAAADAFLNLVDGLSPLAASMHIPANTLPVLPPAPATILDRLSFWLDETAGLTEPVLRNAIDTGTVPLLPPTGITVTSVAPVRADGSQVPGIEVKWNLVGPGQHILIRWRERDTADWQIASVTLAVSTYIIRPILAGKSYDIELARSNGTRQSPWVSATSASARTGLENASVVGLQLTGRDNATEWVGRDVSISWRGAYPGAVIDPATGMAITPTAYMEGYVVKVFDGVTKQLLRQTPPSMVTEYTYSYDSNDTDTGLLLLRGPTRSLRFEVAIVPKIGPAIGTAQLDLTNPAPAKVAVTARTGVGLLQVSIAPVKDADLSRYVVWVSDQPGFDPATTPLVDIGATTEYSQPLLKVGPCYVRAAAVDLFQPKDGLDLVNLNISDEVIAELADITIDKVPPAVPTGLVLSSTAAIANSGETVSTLAAQWERNNEEDFLLYEVQLMQAGGGDWVTSVTGLPLEGRPAFSWTVVPSKVYVVRLRARDRSGNFSDYGLEQQLVAARDEVPPGPPSNLSVNAGARTIMLRWTNPSDADWFETEVWTAVTDPLAGPPASPLDGTRITTVSMDSWVFASPVPGVRYHFWIRAKDASGNASLFAGPVSCDAPLITTADFKAGSIEASILKAGSVLAEHLEVANRGITAENLIFAPNTDQSGAVAENVVSWRGIGGAPSRLLYRIDSTTTRTLIVPSGQVAWNDDVLYLYVSTAEVGDVATILSTTSYSIASRAHCILLATYSGGTRLIATYGTTTITGELITTGAILAGHIKSGEITADIVRIGSGAGQSLSSLLSPDKTTIDGGKITTHSIDTNRLSVSSNQYDADNIEVRAERTSETGLDNLKVQWGKWTGSTLGNGSLSVPDSIGGFTGMPINAGEARTTVGTPLYIYWTPGSNVFQFTTKISTVKQSDILIATVRDVIEPGASPNGLSGLLPSSLKINGNSLLAGQVDARVGRFGEIVVDEVRVGPDVTGLPGIYLRRLETAKYNLPQSNGTNQDVTVNQQTLFCYDGVHRRVEMFRHEHDAGLIVRDKVGNTIFDTYGLGRHTVGTSALRPESATFVRTCRGNWSVNSPKNIMVTFQISGLAETEKATVVFMAFSNGHDSARTTPTVNANRPDSYRMRIRKIGSNPDTNPDIDAEVGGVWLDGNLLMYYQDSVNIGNGLYSYYIHYNKVADSEGNPDLDATSAYQPFTSITALVSMR